MRIWGINNTLSFQRKPTKQEEADIRKNVSSAYELMGTKERAVITHGSCFPAGYYDSSIGSPYGKAAREYIKFLALYGFNNNQLGPCGELEKNSISPYNSSAFAQNRLFIDLEELTNQKYGEILSKDTFEIVTREPQITDKNYAITNLKRAEKIYDIALSEAYSNFKAGLKTGKTLELNNQYQKFLSKHDERLTEEGIFKVLSNKYGTEDYSKWDFDKTLITDIKRGDIDALMRFNELYYDNYNAIEQYKFEQFLITKQIKEHKNWRDEQGFKYINDLLVGCSKMDAWRYEDAFLSDWEMGAYESGSNSQRWHLPVIDPKKIFLNDKYELNIGGEFLKEKIESALEFCENIRIDHVMGMVEPYIMSKFAADSDFKTEPPSVKNKQLEKYISELKDENGNEYDMYWDYPKLLKHLVLPLIEKHGIDKDTAVWEDICTYPSRFLNVSRELELPGITNLDWTRSAEEIKKFPVNWYLIGSHDNPPAMTYPKRTDANKKEYTRLLNSWNADYLANYLNMDDSRKNIEQIRKNLAKLYETDDKALVKAKFIELLTTPKFQISFDDLLGITDIIYNVPGKSNNPNWQARISADYIDKYYENLASDDPTALNIPELLHDALQAKIDIAVKEHNYDNKFKEEIYAKTEPVLNKLAHYAQVLKD